MSHNRRAVCRAKLSVSECEVQGLGIRVEGLGFGDLGFRA